MLGSLATARFSHTATYLVTPPQVLIAGAGPTGLVLALFLTRQGVRVRIVDPGHADGGLSPRKSVVMIAGRRRSGL